MRALAIAVTMVLAVGPAGVRAADNLPECQPVSLADGTPVDLGDHLGKIVYLDFWASWCGPCQLSFPFMNELREEFHPDELEVIAISVDTERDKALRFARRNPSSFTLALDTTGQCPTRFDVDAMPSSYVFGPGGEFLYEHSGFNPSDGKEIRQQIAEAVRNNRGRQ